MDRWQSPLLILLIAALIAVSTAAPAQVSDAPTSPSHLGKDLAARPTSAGERLAMPNFPAGWVRASTPSAPQSGPVEIYEYIPKNQSPQNWQDKITLEVHHGANTLPIDAYHRRALGGLRENCQGVFEGRLQTGVNNGFPAAYWTMGCKRYARGNYGDMRYTKAIQGGETLYLLSRTWRTTAYDDNGPPVSPSAIEEARVFLGSSVACNSAQHPCPKDQAPQP